MYKRIKRADGTIDFVPVSYKLKEGEEEVPEETPEPGEGPEQEPETSEPEEEGGEGEDEKEKALLGKIKGVVTKTVDEKITAFKKNQVLVANNSITKTPLAKKAYDLMDVRARNKWAEMTDKQKKYYEGSVIIAKYLQAQYRGDRAMIKDLSEGTDSEGGYLVPSPLSNRIYEIITAVGAARREMTVLPMSSKLLDLTTLATKPTVAFISEGAQITASDLVFGRKEITALKLAGITAMANELLEDANVDLINYQVQKFGEAMAEAEDAAFFNTSTSAITGILEDTTTTVTMGTGDVDFSDMAYGDLVDVVYSIGAKQRAGARWCFSSYITSLVMQLVDSTGRPIWSRATEGQPATLLGYPVIENDQMPDLSDSAVSTEFLAFGDFKGYLIGDRKAMTSTILKEATVGSTNLAEKDSSGVRVVERIGGVAPTPLQFATLKTAAS